MLAITNCKIFPVSSAPIERGTILIDGGVITAVGAAVQVPDAAEIFDARGKTVTPGFIDAHTHMALINEPQCRPTTYDANELTNPCTQYLRGIDAFNPFDISIGVVRAAGFTSCYTGPGSANVIGGTGFAFKLKKAESVEEMLIPGTEMMKFALGHNPKNIYGTQKKAPGTRMAIAAMLRETLTDAKNYSDALLSAEPDSPKAPKPNFKLDPLVPVVRGERKVRIHCHRNDDIVTAVRICEEFHLNYALEHCTEGWMIRDFLAAKRPDMVIGPLTIGPVKPEVWNSTLRNPALLEAAGLNGFCLTADAGSETQYLPSQIGLCIARGLSWDTGLRAVTIQPAQLLGLSARLGTLETGKDADIAVWSGDPFCNYSLCEATFIDGVLYPGEQA